MALKLLKDLLSTKESDHPVVIMAGGLGKRLRPFTATCPKPLLKVQQRPILEIMLQRFISYGFKDFYFAVNYKAQMIEEYFADGKKWDVRISYLREQKALGTAGALSLLPATLKHSALVINGDVMTQLNFQNLLIYHQQQQATITTCIRQHQHTVPYGVAHIAENQLINIEEKPTHYYFVNAGIYVLSPQVVTNIPYNKALNMTDLIANLIKSGQPTTVYPMSEYWLDVGCPEDFQQAHQDYQDYFKC